MEAQAPRTDSGSSPDGVANKRENKYLLLLIWLLVLTLVYPVQHYVGITERLPGLKILTLVVLITGVHAICQQRWLRFVGTALWILAALLGSLGEWLGFYDGRVLSVATEIVAIAAVVLLVVLVLDDIFRAGTSITRDRLRGAACAYFLMGLAWGLFYNVLDQTSAPAEPAFSLGAPSTTGDRDADDAERRGRRWRLFYFSFVTMTTLGYGDVTPKTPLAEATALLQAGVGQFYLTILVAFLVGLRLAAWMRERAP